MFHVCAFCTSQCRLRATGSGGSCGVIRGRCEAVREFLRAQRGILRGVPARIEAEKSARAGHERAESRNRRRNQAIASRTPASAVSAAPRTVPDTPLTSSRMALTRAIAGAICRSSRLTIRCVMRRYIRKPPHSSAMTAAASSRLTIAMMPRSTFVVVRSIVASQVYRVDPVYPPIAVSANIEGTVILEALVDRDGRVESVKVLRSMAVLDSTGEYRHCFTAAIAGLEAGTNITAGQPVSCVTARRRAPLAAPRHADLR